MQSLIDGYVHTGLFFWKQINWIVFCGYSDVLYLFNTAVRIAVLWARLGLKRVSGSITQKDKVAYRLLLTKLCTAQDMEKVWTNDRSLSDLSKWKWRIVEWWRNGNDYSQWLMVELLLDIGDKAGWHIDATEMGSFRKSQDLYFLWPWDVSILLGIALAFTSKFLCVRWTVLGYAMYRWRAPLT